MYQIEQVKMKYRIKDLENLARIQGILFGSKNRVYKISGEEIRSLMIYEKNLAYPIVKKQVDKKYQKLISTLTELLVSDDDTGTCYQEVLNQIEKFRQIIKNKYRHYLEKKELEAMGKQLTMFQKEAKSRFIELQNSISKSFNRKSSCK